MDDQLYYWGWMEEDNPEHNYFSNTEAKWFRVFRAVPSTVKDDPITNPMSREEAIAYAHRIVKLTGGRILS